MQWNSDQYLKFKKERTQPSIDLANRIKLNDPQKIIDIGCGPGNSTKVLFDRFPCAESITGADFSENMIAKAREEYGGSGIDFMLFDATRDFSKLSDDYDVVFSNACIQWVPDHPKLISDMMGVLKKGGVLAVQTPMNYREPIHRIIAETVESEKWARKFSYRRIFYNLTPEEYHDLLSEISSDFTLWETVYCHRMPSHESIMEWYKGTGLKPYLSQLEGEDATEFEKEIFEKVKEAYPVQKNGEIIFRFPRFFFTAIK